MKISYAYIFMSFLVLLSCGGQTHNPRELIIDDLPFHRAKNAKEYSDLILKAIKTNRDIPILQEFKLNDIEIDERELNIVASMYSSGIGGRNDWKFYDIYALSKEKDESGGFDYAWLDPTGRLGIQIFIQTSHKNRMFYLDKIEMRSRLDVIQSISFPGGEIDNYKKIDYEW